MAEAYHSKGLWIRCSAARLVGRARSQGPSLATPAHAVPRLGVGDNAATDPGRHRDPVFPTLRGAFSGRSRLGRVGTRRSPAPLERPRLLRPRTQPAPGSGDRCRSDRGCLSRHDRGDAGTARYRPVDGSRHRRPSLRDAGADSGWKRKARAGTSPSPRRTGDGGENTERTVAASRTSHTVRTGCGLHPGDHGSRGYRVPTYRSTVSSLPDPSHLRGICGPRRGKVPRTRQAAKRTTSRTAPFLRINRARRSMPSRTTSPARHLGRPVVSARTGRERGLGDIPRRCRHRAGAGRRGTRTCRVPPRLQPLRPRCRTRLREAQGNAPGRPRRWREVDRPPSPHPWPIRRSG